MEQVLKLYTYNGSEDVAFPDTETQIEIGTFTYDAKRMGSAPTIFATIRYKRCLDKQWTGGECVIFNGERYFLRRTPTSSFDNTDSRYKHECIFVSERIALDNVLLYDVVVGKPEGADRPVSNSTSIPFNGTLATFVKLINTSLQYSELQTVNSNGVINGYYVEIDDEILDTDIVNTYKTITFQDQFIGNAIQEIYNTFEIPYYFVGKVIHVGWQEKIIPDTLKYGVSDALLSISKNNANNKVVNRATGIGSSENIPYYYPNETSKGQIEIATSSTNSNLTIDDIEESETALMRMADKLSFDDRVVYTKIENIFPTITKVETQTVDGVFKQLTLSSESTTISKTFRWLDGSKTVPKRAKIVARIHVRVDSMCDVSFKCGIVCTFNNPSYFFDLSKKSETFGVSFEDENIEFDATYAGSSDNVAQVIFNVNLGKRKSGNYYVDIWAYQYINGVVDDEQLEKYYANKLAPYPTITTEEGGESYLWKINGEDEVSEEELGIAINIPSGEEENYVGDSFYIQQAEGGYINPTNNLMPAIYRESKGVNRFYNAKNETYKNETGDYYVFPNPYIAGKPSEAIATFDDIKPTIKEVENKDGLRIDMFSAFDYDENDSDEEKEDESGSSLNAVHPYFFAKLRKLDFNLFDHAIESGEMTVSITSGACAGCNFIIGVDEDSQLNTVQVDENGKLVRDEEGRVVFGTPQDNQNDTINNEVWVALKKDIESYGIMLPNATNTNLRPIAASVGQNDGDTFVIVNILLPQHYIGAAERKLEAAIINYMSENNAEKFNYSVKFSRIFLKENDEVFKALSENSRINIEYDGNTYEMFVSSYSYKMNSADILPEISVELTDTLSISSNAIQNAVSEVKADIMRQVQGINWLNVGLAHFLRKDIDDYAAGSITFRKDVTVNRELSVDGKSHLSGGAKTPNIQLEKQLNLGGYVEGIKGAVLEMGADGTSYMEVDRLKVRMKAYFEELEIQKVNTTGGKLILSPAGSIKCVLVLTRQELIDNYNIAASDLFGSDFYRCYFHNEQDGVTIENYFKANDQAYCQSFNIIDGTTSNASNKYYWRLVVGVGSDYIDLANYNGGYAEGSDAPAIGDVICQLGSKVMVNGEYDKTRQNAIISSSVDSYSPSITLFNGIDSFSLEGKEIIQMGVNNETGNAFFNVYGNMYIGDKDENPDTYLKYTKEEGLEIKGKLIVKSSGKTVEDLIAEATPEDYDAFKESITKAQTDIDNLQNQIDGAIETWFYEGVPTLENEPSVNWGTDALKNIHLGDLYYDGDTGKAYRFQTKEDENENTVYYWKEITDTDIQAALDAAKKAQDTADGKRRVFVDIPTPPYDKGDLWANATYGEYENELLRCKNNKASGEIFDIEDWELASKSVEESLQNARLGKFNLLRNSGFTGDYVTTQIDDKLMDEQSQMFSDPYIHWTAVNATVQDSDTSQSGYEMNILSGYLSQELKQPIIAGENYVFSLKAKTDTTGNAITFSVGGYSEAINLSDAYTSYYIYFKAVSSDSVFTLSSSDATVCELQLERGTIASAWGNSMWDNQSTLAQYQALTYLSDAFKNGSTETLGGLFMADIIMCGDSNDNEVRKITSGMSGIYSASEEANVVFWAGGSLEQAILTVNKFAGDPSYQPTEEEWESLASYVVTHEGNAFIRGYIYALGGIFKGTVYANGGEFNNVTAKNIKAEDSEFTGKVTATSGKIGGWSIDGSSIKSEDPATSLIVFGKGHHDNVGAGEMGVEMGAFTQQSDNDYLLPMRLHNAITIKGVSRQLPVGHYYRINGESGGLAFAGYGDGMLNGAIDGYRAISYELTEANQEVYVNFGRENGGNRFIIYCTNSSGSIILPNFWNLCSRFGIDPSQPFSVRMSIVAGVRIEGGSIVGSYSTFYVYGRGKAGVSEGILYPQLISNGGSEMTGGRSMGIGDTLELMLTYDGGDLSEPNTEYSYQAYLMNYSS